MNPLDLYSERYSPSGNLASSGVLNQLGRPKLDILQVLVREAVQNSWDARGTDSTVVRFGMAGWSLSSQQRKLLREIIFPHIPNHLNLDFSQQESVNVLAIYDRGTTGLGGPTRADTALSESEASSFVDFIRNVGQPPTKQFSGGTYGYGKAAFYRASQVRTICVHTRCLYQNQLQSRFIVAALGEPYSDQEHRYTGRHWWGRLDENLAEPVLDKEADELAQQLGLPTFSDEELGTTIVVLQPTFGERTPRQAMNFCVECLLWYFWPKMLKQESDQPAMQFQVQWEGDPIKIPHPSDFPPLQGFVQAMGALKTEEEKPSWGKIVSIDARRPKKHLGRLSLQRFPLVKRNRLDSGDKTGSFIEHRSHHVALMRQAELIVKYLPGPALPTDYIEYAGVFITDKEVDDVFANAEPPTHDNWTHEFLEEKTHKTFIRVALRRIKEEINKFVRPPMTQTEGTELTPLGAFANLLGELLPGQEGPGATFMPLKKKPTLIREQTVQPKQEKQKTAEPAKDSPDVSNPQLGHQKPQSQHSFKDSKNVSDQHHQNSKSPEPAKDSLDLINQQTQHSKSPERSKKSSNPFTYKTKTRKSYRKRANVRLVNHGELIIFNGMPALQVEFFVQHATHSKGTRVKAQVGAVLDSGKIEPEPPVGSTRPQVVEWKVPHGTIRSSPNEIFIPHSVTNTCQVIINISENVMIGFEFTATAVKK